MTTETTPGSRERLLEAAAALTYREGVNVGVDALCRAAGVSKRSLYKLFESKGELLAASLEEHASAQVTALFPEADDTRPPRERILRVFEQTEAQANDPGFQGC